MKNILSILKENGPLTGAELYSATNENIFQLWKKCVLSEDIVIRRIGTRYLRLDKFVDGYARLSPSISREFMTYSVIGLNNQKKLISKKIEELNNNIKNISIYKLNLAKQFVSYIIHNYTDTLIKNNQLTVILAGDIVYNMAHNVPRAERSTGKLVKGSDLDLIFILDDKIPKNIFSQLDESIYNLKYQYLINPTINEEIDYIVKYTGKIKKQIEFNTFKKMIACKILHEGILLAGSNELFNNVKKLLKKNDINSKLNAMFENAAYFRTKTGKLLLKNNFTKPDSQNNYIFYTAEESEEFE